MTADSGPTEFPRPDLLPERLADWITDEIVNGRFAPGERLVEQSLSKRCNVSRVPLREALRIVAGRGLLTIEPHRGAVVTPLSEDELNDLFGLRLALEGFAAAAVAMADPRPDLSPLHRLNAEMENCIAAGDIDAYNNVANAFHGAIVTAAGNGLLRDAYDRVKARFRRYQTVMANIPHLPPRSVSEHEQILVAMENGDASAARDLAEEHIRDLVAAYRDTAQDRNLFTKAS